jgi:hypothetical protein
VSDDPRIGVGHVHDWGAKRYIDGCHYVVIERSCKLCPAVREDISDREFDLNPLQIAFARQDCERCQNAVGELRPASWAA